MDEFAQRLNPEIQPAVMDTPDLMSRDRDPPRFFYFIRGNRIFACTQRTCIRIHIN